MQPGQVIQPQSKDDNVSEDNEAEVKLPEITRPKRSIAQEQSENKEMNTRSGSTASIDSKENSAETKPKDTATPNLTAAEQIDDAGVTKTTPKPVAERAEPNPGLPAQPAVTGLDIAKTQRNAGPVPEAQKEVKSPKPETYETKPDTTADSTGVSDVVVDKTVADEIEAKSTSRAEPEAATNNTDFAVAQSKPIGSKAAATPAVATADDGKQAEPVDRTPLASWQAAEYIQHHHSPLWYAGLGALTIGFLLLLVLVLHEWLSAVVVLLVVVSIVVYAHRAPRTLAYTLTATGIMIGEKYFPYSDFHSFAVLPYHGQMNVELDPLKRFMPRISLPADEQNLDAVIEVLGPRLPRSDRKPDPIDRLTHYLKL
jgi:hypothetical protein